MSNLPTSRPLNVDIPTDNITESNYKAYYNFQSMTGLNIKQVDIADTDVSGGGVRITKALDDKVVLKFEQINYVFSDLVLMKKHDEYDNQQDISCNLYEYSFLIRTIKDDFSTRLNIEIPIHNYEDVSKNTILEGVYTTNAPARTLATNIINDIANNIADIINDDLVSLSDNYTMDLDSFVPKDCEYFIYNYKESSELIRYIFIDPENSPIVLHNDTIDTIYNTIFYSIQSSIQSVTQQLVTINEFITYNKTVFEYKISPEKANPNFDPEIYIDCQPSDNSNTNTIVSLTNNLLSGDTKEKVDKFLVFLLNIILIFIVVYFLYYKLPSFMNVGKSAASNSVQAPSSNSG